MTIRHLLAFESSGTLGGVALLADGQSVATKNLDEGLTHGRLLLPAAEACLREAGIRATDLAAVAVSAGPGSYTGTRVGVMAAKALAYGLGIPVIGVSSLEALAWTAAKEGVVLAVQNARRDEVYAGAYRIEPDGPVSLSEEGAFTPEETVAKALRWADGGMTLAAGSGVEAYRELFQAAMLSCGCCNRLRLMPMPAGSAEMVARLGWRRFIAGERDDPLQLQPRYWRRDGDGGWTKDKAIQS